MNNPFLLALRIKSFLFLWLSEAFSQIAMNMLNFILILLVFTLTNSNTAVSGVVLSFTIPAIFFGVLAGVYVDHWNKKYVLFATNILRFGLLILLAIFHKNLPTVYTLSFLSAIVTQFFIPAETPMIPLLVKKELLFAANALFSMAWFGAVLVAYALSGPFLLLFGKTNALLALAIIFLVASVFAMLINVPKLVEKKQIKRAENFNFIEEVKKAFSVIIRIRDVSHAFSLLILSQILIIIISVIGPGYAKQILHINIESFPLLFVTPAVVGMAVGSYIVTNFFSGFSRHKSATLGLLFAAITVFLMPYGSDAASRGFVHFINGILPFSWHISILNIMMLLAFGLGFSNSFIFVPSNTLIQEQTSDAVRGKIYGALNTAASLISLIPVIIVGSLADLFGVGTVLTVLAIIIAIIGLFRSIFL
ncbi:MAG TPA: MFS transporter [Patescibacteria group bacterium]